MTSSKPKPRVAIVAFNFRQAYDGATKTLTKITDELERRKIPFLVLSTQFDEIWNYEYGERFKLSSIPWPLYWDYRLCLSRKSPVFKRLDEFAPTVIHVSTPCRAGHVGAMYASAKKIPLIGIYHSHLTKLFSLYALPLVPLAKHLLQKFYNKFDLLLVPTQHIIRELHDHNICPPMKQWARGVEPELFSPEHCSLEWRKKMGAEKESVIILYAGRLVKEKRLKELARASKILKKTHENIVWVFAGQGAMESYLRRHIPNARFLGHISRDILNKVYASSDIFVYPSDTETFGNAILEAMASGLPVITSDDGGSSELVQAAYGSGMLLFPNGDHVALARKLQWIISDSSIRSRLRENSIAYAGKHRWSPLIEEILEEYYRLSKTDYIPLAQKENARLSL
ncbi:MAG: hypothetical protein COV43_00555 [Deltaproteobacteria bacterium CG11_big_fil_rev_8_21_14_0_20_42_23]|nr:MAG: hypothetical protein COV43_00555 [Deltaproteobacteria bacterium CG11_big_fil_rev_8_21_14_0_20_42_23]PJC64510.1 MAG: hypothetical protein CO021_03540 [Deltaproteobacteria bacterium CG_4_9_14_0_2_um_filter_42_21]